MALSRSTAFVAIVAGAAAARCHLMRTITRQLQQVQQKFHELWPQVFVTGKDGSWSLCDEDAVQAKNHAVLDMQAESSLGTHNIAEELEATGICVAESLHECDNVAMTPKSCAMVTANTCTSSACDEKRPGEGRTSYNKRKKERKERSALVKGLPTRRELRLHRFNIG